MLRKGYWVECIPVNGNLQQEADGLSYTASAASFPDVCAHASSPDKAIEALRSKLNRLKEQYEAEGEVFPALDNPLEPSHRHRRVYGWISVYMKVEEFSECE